MSTILWAAVLLVTVWATHWGAKHLADPVKKLCRQWGSSAQAKRISASHTPDLIGAKETAPQAVKLAGPLSDLDF